MTNKGSIKKNKGFGVMILIVVALSVMGTASSTLEQAFSNFKSTQRDSIKLVEGHADYLGHTYMGEVADSDKDYYCVYVGIKNCGRSSRLSKDTTVYFADVNDRRCDDKYAYEDMFADAMPMIPSGRVATVPYIIQAPINSTYVTASTYLGGETTAITIDLQ